MRRIGSLSMVAFLFVLLTTTLAQATTTVGHIVFSTAPQTILVGEISDAITIQSQNIGGVATQVGEISNLTLASSSPSGEFSSSQNNWIPVSSLTWNSNWANKIFYYRDSTVGDFVITATLAVRNGGPSWQTTQGITVTPEPATAMLLLPTMTLLRRRRTR